MKTKKNLYYVIGVALLIVQLAFLVTKCQPDKCTQPAFKEKFKVGMTLKSSLSSKSTTTAFVPHTRENPYWMDWAGRNIDLTNLSGWYISGIGINETDQTYYTSTWIGFQNSITIPEGEELHMRSVNCVIKGDVHGSGTFIFESYQSGRNYNSPIGAILVVEGVVDDSVNLVLNDNTTLELGIPLSDNDGGLGEKVKVDVPCDWELPITVSDENGVKWYYTSYN